MCLQCGKPGFIYPDGEDPLAQEMANPLQYSCLKNPVDRRAWQATVHRVTKSLTPLKQLSTEHNQLICLHNQSAAITVSKGLDRYRLGVLQSKAPYYMSLTSWQRLGWKNQEIREALSRMVVQRQVLRHLINRQVGQPRFPRRPK